MSEISKLSDHEAARRLQDVLANELKQRGDKSALLLHLKQNHTEVYSGLISECSTHGSSIKGKISDFASDASKTLPADRMNGVRKALLIAEEKPHLIATGKSNAGWWVAGIVAAVGVGAYLINEYGKPKKKGIGPKTGDWKDLVERPTASGAQAL